MYKTVEEVTRALAVKLDMGLTKKSYDGYDSVPWNEATRLLDDIFGVFGWSERVLSTYANPQAGVYGVARELTVYAVDEKGSTVSKTVSAVGACPVRGESGKAHKTAFMGADSLSFSKATKKLGEAFGLFLYDKDEDEDSSNHESAPRKSAGAKSSGDRGDDIRPSEKQLFVLTNKAGYTEDDIDSMNFKTWKAALDAWFKEGKGKAKGKATAAKKAKPADDDEDEEGLPF